MKTPVIFSVIMTMLFLFSGCKDSNAPKTAAQKNTTVTDRQAPRITYTATLAEGIDFKREGYPSFVSTITGMAEEKESFGRWSTGDEVSIGFVNPLPMSFNVELEVAAFGPNVNKPIKISAADKEQEFIINSGHPEKMQKITIHFTGVERATSIKFKIPLATSPKALVGNPDERRLGIAFERIRIY